MKVLRIMVHTLLLTLGLMTLVRAGEGVPSSDKMILLFLKVITYDQSFAFDDTKTVTVYLPYEQSNATSYEQFRASQKFFDKNENLTVEGARVRLVPFPVDDADSVLPAKGGTDYGILLMTSLAAQTVQRLLESTANSGLKSFSLDPALIPLGIAVSAKATEKKNSIIVNLVEAQREGSRFAAPLLKMCEIYEAPS